MDIYIEPSYLCNFLPSELNNSYIVYGLALLIFAVISYFVYKYFMNQQLIVSTNIDYLDADENQEREKQKQYQEQEQEQYINNNEN